MESLCSYPDCWFNAVEGKKFCRKHTPKASLPKAEPVNQFNPPMACAVVSCTEVAKARSFCSKHHAAFKKGQLTDKFVIPKRKKYPENFVCLSCKQKDSKYRQGFCGSCYKKFKNGYIDFMGCPTDKERKDAEPKICTVGNCDRKAEAWGMCRLHRYRKVRNLPLEGPIITPKKFCNVEGCDRPHKSVGMCEYHRRRVREGKPVVVTPRHKNKDRLCRESACERPAAVRQLCDTHYRVAKRNGQLLD